MAIELYGVMGSQPVRTVVAFCQLNNISYNFHNVDLSKGEQRTEEFRKISPFEYVPCIVHGDYSLWESGAIVTYLADAFDIDSVWYPKDLRQRSRINSYIHWHHSNTRVFVRGYVYNTVIDWVV